MELKVEELQELKPIKFNYEELKKQLEEQIKVYKTAVYTDENISAAKDDRARLNKLKKSINDKKIEIKKEVLKPYEECESKLLELIGIVDDGVINIDSQVKAYEQKKKDEKLVEITKYFSENVGIYENLINFDRIYNERWLNVTYELETIKKEIDHIIAKAKNDLLVIDGSTDNESIIKQLEDFYFNNIANSNVLGMTLQEKMRLEKIQENLSRLNNEKKKENNNSDNNATVQKQARNELEELGIKYIEFAVLVNEEECKKIGQILKENNITYGKIGVDLLGKYKETH